MLGPRALGLRVPTTDRCPPVPSSSQAVAARFSACLLGCRERCDWPIQAKPAITDQRPCAGSKLQRPEGGTAHACASERLQAGAACAEYPRNSSLSSCVARRAREPLAACCLESVPCAESRRRIAPENRVDHRHACLRRARYERAVRGHVRLHGREPPSFDQSLSSESCSAATPLACIGAGQRRLCLSRCAWKDLPYLCRPCIGTGHIRSSPDDDSALRHRIEPGTHAIPWLSCDTLSSRFPYNTYCEFSRRARYDWTARSVFNPEAL